MPRLRRFGAESIAPAGSRRSDSPVSRDTLLHNLRVGELLPPARTNEQEVELIETVPAPVVPAHNRQLAAQGGSGKVEA